MGDAARRDDYVIEPTVEDTKDCIQEVVVDRTADAAVFQFYHVVGSRGDQVAVDADLAELVDNDGSAQALLVSEDVLDEGRLAAAEEAGDHGHGQAGFGIFRRGSAHDAIRSVERRRTTRLPAYDKSRAASKVYFVPTADWLTASPKASARACSARQPVQWPVMMCGIRNGRSPSTVSGMILSITPPRCSPPMTQ